MAVGVRGLSFAYPRKGRSPASDVLSDVSLEIEQGQWVALRGANGSGKSTLLKLLAGLLTPSSGTIEVFGERGHPGSVRARIAVLLQFTALDPILTVRENLRVHAATFGVAEDRIEAWASRMGVAERLMDRASTLSGGLARRADLARALSTSPDLLLLDEPTSPLDDGSRAAFLDDLRGLRDSRGLTVIMATHREDESSLADREILLEDGRVVRDEDQGS